MAVTVGDVAPNFDLPGIHDGDQIRLQLSDIVDQEKSVLLAFYCCDFSPVCTRQMCDYQDIDWYSYKNDLQVLGLNRESVFAHQEFARQNDLSYPLLSDVSGEVHDKYDAFTEFEGMSDITRRSIFLIDQNRRVQYAWQCADNWESPPFNPIQEAIKNL